MSICKISFTARVLSTLVPALFHKSLEPKVTCIMQRMIRNRKSSAVPGHVPVSACSAACSAAFHETVFWALRRSVLCGWAFSLARCDHSTSQKDSGELGGRKHQSTQGVRKKHMRRITWKTSACSELVRWTERLNQFEPNLWTEARPQNHQASEPTEQGARLLCHKCHCRLFNSLFSPCFLKPFVSKSFFSFLLFLKSSYLKYFFSNLSFKYS